MSVSTKNRVHNQFCREPDAGKPHVRFCAGVRLVRGVSTHQVLLTFSVWEVLVIYLFKKEKKKKEKEKEKDKEKEKSIYGPPLPSGTSSETPSTWGTVSIKKPTGMRPTGRGRIRGSWICSSRRMTMRPS